MLSQTALSTALAATQTTLSQAVAVSGEHKQSYCAQVLTEPVSAASASATAARLAAISAAGTYAPPSFPSPFSWISLMCSRRRHDALQLCCCHCGLRGGFVALLCRGHRRCGFASASLLLKASCSIVMFQVRAHLAASDAASKLAIARAYTDSSLSTAASLCAFSWKNDFVLTSFSEFTHFERQLLADVAQQRLLECDHAEQRQPSQHRQSRHEHRDSVQSCWWVIASVVFGCLLTLRQLS